MAQKETISIKLNPGLWLRVRHRCLDEGKQYSEFVEAALEEALQKAV